MLVCKTVPSLQYFFMQISLLPFIPLLRASSALGPGLRWRGTDPGLQGTQHIPTTFEWEMTYGTREEISSASAIYKRGLEPYTSRSEEIGQKWELPSHLLNLRENPDGPRRQVRELVVPNWLERVIPEWTFPTEHRGPLDHGGLHTK